jgi:hypothetical protein
VVVVAAAAAAAAAVVAGTNHNPTQASRVGAAGTEGASISHLWDVQGHHQPLCVRVCWCVCARARGRVCACALCVVRVCAAVCVGRCSRAYVLGGFQVVEHLLGDLCEVAAFGQVLGLDEDGPEVALSALPEREPDQEEQSRAEQSCESDHECDEPL